MGEALSPASEPSGSIATLRGKRGLVVGIANRESIAWGCALACRRAGAEIAVTALNEKAEAHVRPLADEIGSPLLLPLDVTVAGQAEAAFESVRRLWGGLDFLVHAIAFAPRDDLHGRVTDCSRDGFLRAMHVSCWSLIEMARLAEPLMAPGGGAIVTMTFYGADKVVEHYNLMGPVKAALQATVRSLAAELAPGGIRVHAVSAGPVRTRAAGGIGGFDLLHDAAVARAPQRRAIDIEEIGATTAFLVSDAARAMTGDVLYVDGGRHVMA